MEAVARDSKDFNNRLLSLKNRKKLCDADLIVNGQRIPVHTVILSASSEYFENVFVDSGLKEVVFDGINIETIQSFIEFFYTGIIRIAENNLDEIFKLANILTIPSIVESCSKILENKLNVDNCLSTWKIGIEGDLKNLKLAALKFIQDNFENISSSKEFLTLQYMNVEELLNSDLSVDSEETVFNAVKKWVKHDEELRKEKLVDLLGHVRLSCIPQNLLILDSLSLCNSVKCYEKFNNAIKLQYDNTEECIRTSTLIAIGEWDFEISKKIEIFDLSNQQWIEININCNKRRFSTVLMGENLLLIGGDTPNSTVNSIDTYNLRTGKTDSFTPMKYARNQLTAVQHRGALYVLGGYNNKVVSNMEKWDPSSKSWIDLTPMSIGRYAHRAVMLAEEIIIAGGYSTAVLSLTEAYNTVTNTWRTCASMNEARYYFGMTAIKGYLYAVGGYKSDRLKTAERYDSKIDKWTMIESIAIARLGIVAGNYQGKLIIVGGHPGVRSTTVEIYDEEANKWKPMASLKAGRYVFDLVQIPLSLAKHALSRNVLK